MEPMPMPAATKEFWYRLAILTCASGLSAAFGAGAAITNLSGRMTAIESRVSRVENADPQKTQWQVDQLAQVQASMLSREDRMASDVGNINSHLSGIDVKLDAIAESLRAKH